uniref:Uncharacterized protein n=1 Tax=Arundo donax TaxID=35708 RepID=A0A0A9AFX4_ARUDO
MAWCGAVGTGSRPFG